MNEILKITLQSVELGVAKAESSSFKSLPRQYYTMFLSPKPVTRSEIPSHRRQAIYPYSLPQNHQKKSCLPPI